MNFRKKHKHCFTWEHYFSEKIWKISIFRGLFAKNYGKYCCCYIRFQKWYQNIARTSISRVRSDFVNIFWFCYLDNKPTCRFQKRCHNIARTIISRVSSDFVKIFGFATEITSQPADSKNDGRILLGPLFQELEVILWLFIEFSTLNVSQQVDYKNYIKI